MKLLCTGTIRSMQRETSSTGPSGLVAIDVAVPADAGAVTTAPGTWKGPVDVRLSFTVRSVVADQLRFGQLIRIAIEDVDPNETRAP